MNPMSQPIMSIPGTSAWKRRRCVGGLDERRKTCCGFCEESRSTPPVAAYEPVAQAVERIFGSTRADAARGVEQLHDHGNQYRTNYFQGQSRFHGFTPSFAFVGEPQTNGVVERFNPTLKEQIIHGRTYKNREELAAAPSTFTDLYNREWRLEKLRYLSPLEARRDYQPSIPLAA